MYQTLRSSGNLSYAVVEQMFEEHQSKWSEAIFNEDAQFKYIDPFVNSNANYLYMLLGSKAEQRKWWLYNRFRYIDSKYIAGDASTDTIFLRPYEAEDITLTPYADIYATIKWDATTTQERAARNEEVTLECPYQSMNGNIVTIYSSSQLASIGDISPLKVGQIDISNATRLQSLKVGDSASTYDNGNLYSITFGSNVLMQSIDVRNCSGLGDTSIQGHTQQTVDLSGCPIIEDIYFSGTKITGLTLPNGGVIKTLDLPDTITNLTILNQPSITTFSVEGDDYSNISTLRIENCSSVIPVMDILGDMSENSRVRIIGFSTTASSTQDVEDFFDMLDTMRGLDEQGNNIDNAVASGTITGLGTITGAWLAEMNARYPDITITYQHITSYLYYYNGDTLYYTESITDGGNGVYAGTPSKANSADGHYSYTFAGWSKENDDTVDADARTAVTADRNVYACYTENVRTYTVTWINNGTTIETDTNVPWGTVPTYNGSTPTKDGQTSTGWLPDPTQPITGDTTFTAQYLPIYTVTFKNDTGSTTLDTQRVLQGQTATYGGTTPTSSEDATLAWLGWATSANSHQANAVLTNVQSSMTVYAAFKANAPSSTDVTDTYGVEWDYSNSSPALTRVGLATSFADPTPATSVSGSGSSPFDNIAPWKDMKRYNVINGEISYSQDDTGFDETLYDTVVYIPEFWYTAIKDETNSKWLWAVSPTKKTGYQKHPGSGRYVGRFHTGGSANGVFTKSGLTPLANTTQTDFRTYSHNKGSNWYMMDLASWSAIQMLYLIEFATFYSQDALGKGWNTGSVGTMGGTTGATYHTIKTTGAHNQYRWIEDPFSNVLDSIDGFIASSGAVYAGVSDTGYTGSTSDLANTGITLPSPGSIQGFGYSADTPWAFIPDTASGSDSTTYVTDRVYSGSNTGICVARVGGVYNDFNSTGFFCIYVNNPASTIVVNAGSRLIYIP